MIVGSYRQSMEMGNLKKSNKLVLTICKLSLEMLEVMSDCLWAIL